MNLQETWRYVYATFPARLGRTDCWQRCEGPHRCCRPGQPLLLMPGEAAYLISEGVEGIGGDVWVCPGRDGCLGVLRPMCCRTYPVHPAEDGTLMANTECSQYRWASLRFIRDLKRAWARLWEFEEIRDWCRGMRRFYWADWPEVAIDDICREYDGGYAAAFGRYHQVTARKEMIADQATTPGERVLDVGCGDGQGVAELRAQGVEAYGIDVNPTFAGEHCQTGDARDLPFPDKSFDACICIDLLEHLPDWERALAEMARVTRKRMLVSVTPLENAQNYYEDPTHCVPMRWREWRVAFEEYGKIIADSTYPWAALVELNGE